MNFEMHIMIITLPLWLIPDMIIGIYTGKVITNVIIAFLALKRETQFIMEQGAFVESFTSELVALDDIPSSIICNPCHKDGRSETMAKLFNLIQLHNLCQCLRAIHK